MASRTKRKRDLFSDIVIFVLLVYLVLQTYGYGHNNFAFIIMSVLAVLALFRTGIHNYMPKLLNCYFVFWGISHIVMASSASSISIVPIGVIRTYLVYNMLFREFDYSRCVKLYSILAIVFIAFFFVQELIYTTTGYRLLGIFQSLPLALGVDDASTYYEKMITTERSSSVFSEPAHFVQFLLPLLAIKLFNPVKKIDLLFAGIIALVLLLTQSGNAVLGLIAIGGFFIFSTLFYRTDAKKLILFVVMLITIVFAGHYYINSEMGQRLLERQDQLDVSGNSETGQSGFKRLYRGYYVFGAMSPLEMIMGADDVQRIDNAISSSSVAGSFLKNDYYFNTVQSLLIRTGLIGTFIFLLFMISSLKRVTRCGKAILLTWIVLCFVSAHHFTPTMALYLLLGLSFAKEKKTQYSVTKFSE